jgi:hypothetical protein
MCVLQPYLHQSRHNHAQRRIRGPTGRFLTSEEVKALQAVGELSGTSNSASASAQDKERPSDSQGQSESSTQQQQQQQGQGAPTSALGQSTLVRSSCTLAHGSFRSCSSGLGYTLGRQRQPTCAKADMSSTS